MFRPLLKYLAIACSLCIVALLATNCSNDHTQLALDHSFQADDSSTYTLTLRENSILVKRNGSKIDSAVLLVFLTDGCQTCQEYYEHLNHLQTNHENLRILGILTETGSNDLQTFKKDLGINFTLLQDVSKTPLLENILAQKQARANAIIQADTESNNMDSNQAATIQDGKPQTKQEARPLPQTSPQEVDSTSTSQRSIASEQTLSPESTLPYFVLYDTQQHFYQDYEGIVPEEIFSSDIAQLAH